MKKILIYIGLVLIALVSIGAVTLKGNSVAGHGFIANGSSADFTAGEILKAGVADKSIYLERVYLSAVGNTTFYLVEGDLGTSGATATLVGPIYVLANTTESIVFTRPLKLTGSSPFAIDTGGAVAGTVVAQGYIQ